MTRETVPLSLTDSLETDVRRAYAVPARSESLGKKALCAALGTLIGTQNNVTEALRSAGYMQASGEHQAILDWIDDTFSHWATVYPLAPELQHSVNGIKPLAAAFAIKDERFFTPGGHGFHRLMDTIHNGLIGWQSTLEGPASNALDGVRDALERAVKDFPSEPQVDETTALLSQKTAGHDAQLVRLDAVLLEREHKTLGAELARLATASAINSILLQHQVPGSVARFIKSDWYESGVLVGEQSGVDSAQWQTFIATTQDLVDAVQPIDTSSAEGQQRIDRAMQQLPGTLSRQLLSLQPDNDAIAGAIGLIEYALLRNMRGEDLGLLLAEPISTSGLPNQQSIPDNELEQLGLVAGHWFAIDTPEGERRVRLCGTLGNNLYLLFMDFLGARALRKPTHEFKALMQSGEARALSIPDSFCRAMTEACHNRVLQYQAEKEAEEIEQAARAEAEAREQEQLIDTLSGAASRDYRSGFEADASLEPDRDPKVAARAFQETVTPDPSADQASVNHNIDASHRAIVPEKNNDKHVPSKDEPYNSNTVVKLNIPMGTWMGFHDREPPMMAKVAVRDLEKDSYIFTNRDGIKLRELTVAQLVALIDRDMVDILERKSNFRETVNQMRRDQERLSSSP